MKILSDWLLYLFFRAVAGLMNLIPYPFAIRIGRAFGVLLFRLLKRRRNIALENLRAAFPEKSEREIERIAIGAFQNIGQLAIEFVCIPKLSKRGFCKVAYVDRVFKALEQKKGVILIVSHLTNWEVMAVATGNVGLPMYAIGRPLKNKFVYRYVKRLRGHGGLKSIEKDGAIRNVIRLLRENNVVSFLIDQHERQGAVRTKFFRRECSTSNFAARIAIEFGVPVVFTYCYRESDGSLVTHFDEPFKLIRTQNEKADILTNTQMFLDAIEKRVREMPENWLWMHRRWRDK